MKPTYTQPTHTQPALTQPILTALATCLLATCLLIAAFPRCVSPINAAPPTPPMPPMLTTTTAPPMSPMPPTPTTTTTTATTATLEKNFATPPDDARPWVFWFWSDGNITREGITADLEAMQRVGIGGVLIMEIDQGVPKGPVRMVTQEWRDMFAFAVGEMKRLGLQLIMNNDPGWTGSGGPWNTPENSMQKVTWTERRVTGPVTFDDALKQPETNMRYYRDIAVLAFPTPPSETRAMRDHKPSVTTNTATPAAELSALFDGDKKTGALLPRPKNRGEWPRVELAFEEPLEACSIEVDVAFAKRGTGAAAGRVLCELQVSDDGRVFREIARTPANGTPKTFAPVKAKYFRVALSGNDASMDGLRVNEITLASAFRTDAYEAKSGLGLAASPVETAGVTAGMSVSKNRIQNLSAHLREGRLRWDVPEGEWTILRFGHTSTGRVNYPAPGDARGLEVDKLSAAALDKHFDGFLGKLVKETDAAGTGAGTFAGMHIDSWEVGFQNWTPKFRGEFERLRGYDPLPWLPAITGRIVGDAALSERFLWDVRRTISDLLNENYAGRMAALAHRHGRIFSLEGYRNGPFDPLTYAGRADLPMGEFWVTPDLENQHPSVKTMASAGHIYGRNVIGAEAFTASDLNSKHRVHPYAAKAIGDAAFCAGINHFIVHRYSMQPWTDDRKPGMTMGPWGWEYERTATWWEQSRPWHEYLARCQYMLRQGTFVADICYLQDEEGIKNPPPRKEILPAPPEGYDYDLCSGEVVLTRMSVKDGRLTLPDGVGYRVLVMPRQRLMTPALLRKIRDLVRDGATVLGAPPLRSPGLRDYPACDEEVRKLVAEVWGDCDGARVKERTFGKGRVVWGKSLEETLLATGAQPDFTYRNIKHTAGGAAQPGPRLHYIHRTTPGQEIYFVANPDPKPADVTALFRVAGRKPQFWRPDCGTVVDMPVYDAIEGTHTSVPLKLGPRESVFVVFRKDQPADSSRITAVSRGRDIVMDAKNAGGKIIPVAADSGQPRDLAGDFSYAASYEGTATSASKRGITGDFSYAAWVKPAANMAVPVEDFAGTSSLHVARNDLLFPPQGVEYYQDPTAAGAGLAVGKNVICVLEHSAFHFVSTLVYPVSITDWTHVAVVYHDGWPALYINGSLVRTGLRTLYKVRGAVDAEQDDTGGTFVGEHSALRLFERALGETEIRELMRTMPRESVAPVAKIAVQKETKPANTTPPVLEVSFEKGRPVIWTSEPGNYKIHHAGGSALDYETGPMPAPLTIDGAWTLRFPEGWGAPPEVTLPGLMSWSDHAIPGVKYFSGTAVYTKSFVLPAVMQGANRRLWLDLGDVQVNAQVRLNGRDLGILWKPPFRVDITDAVREGANTLEIAVTNTWVNRLIGDEQLPADREWVRVPRRRGYALKAYPDWFLRGERSPTGRITFTTWKHYDKNASPLPSGLLGPVIIQP
ncbi:MAG: hypothetical protein LBM04_13735, partial [Opitutaceae bacterium]|nr:hypothetical protein [Opitutaceae bacterium]